jgi:DNA-binding CsgD family transcriptional regulator
VLHGRGSECAAVEDLIADARSGVARTLVFEGDAGIGKTALLDYAAASASGMTVLRSAGVEAESDLAFAGLHALLRPLFGYLGQIPDAHAAALSSAIGLADAPDPGRLLISAGVLSLLAEAAEKEPLLCLIDDVHWMDRPSLDALMFAARRLEADAIAMIFATRRSPMELAGVDRVELRPLAPSDAERLLDAAAGPALSPRQRERVLATACGSPLALSELAADLLASGGEHEGGLPISAVLERAFAWRASTLSAEAQMLLLVAAADDSGDVGLLVEAAAALGIDPDALAIVERSRLLDVADGRFRFRHPLLRSAVYQAASFSDRQLVHQALGDALTGTGHDDRRAWHRAAAAVFPDEDVARDLERAARRSATRGAHEAASSALERASRLTASVSWRADLLTTAAVEAWEAASPQRAQALVELAARAATEPLAVARVVHLRGHFEARVGNVLDATAILLDGARRVADLDPRLAATMLLDAAQAASYGGDVERYTRVAEQAATLPSTAGVRLNVGFMRGEAALMHGDFARSAELLTAADAQVDVTGHPEDLWAAAGAAGYRGDIDTACARFEDAVAAARAAGAAASLSQALEGLAYGEVTRHPARAESHAAEGLQLARETGQVRLVSSHLTTLGMVAGIRGDESACRAAVDEALTLAHGRGLGMVAGRAELALAYLDLGAGRPELALARLTKLVSAGPGHGHPVISLYETPELVEAAVRAGVPAAAETALDRFARWVEVSGHPWNLAALARCRAMLANGDEAEERYTEALTHHAGTGATYDAARTSLLYGEYLRRQRRRLDARPHLRAAIDYFERLGAVPWTARAHAELRATGETARRRDVDTRQDLTPQELQIAGLVAGGATNRDVAAQLFISTRTVDYHLRKVFTKLDLSSRRELQGVDLAS